MDKTLILKPVYFFNTCQVIKDQKTHYPFQFRCPNIRKLLFYRGPLYSYSFIYFPIPQSFIEYLSARAVLSDKAADTKSASFLLISTTKSR